MSCLHIWSSLPPHRQSPSLIRVPKHLVDSCGALIDFENVWMILASLKIPWNDELVVLIELRDINAKLQRALGGRKGRWGSTVNRGDAELTFGFKSNRVCSAVM